MGFPHLVAFQLLCPPLHCLHVSWKGYSFSVYFSILLLKIFLFCTILNFRGPEAHIMEQSYSFKSVSSKILSVNYILSASNYSCLILTAFLVTS